MTRLKYPLILVFNKEIPKELKPMFLKWATEVLNVLNIKGQVRESKIFVRVLEELEEKSATNGKVETQALLFRISDFRWKLKQERNTFPLIVYVCNKDLFYQTQNFWIFGGTSGAIATVFSISRFVKFVKDRAARAAALKYMFQHELGHLFEACERARPYIVENYGKHCSVRNCAMQQARSIRETIKIASRISESIYCGYCKQDSEITLKQPLYRAVIRK